MNAVLLVPCLWAAQVVATPEPAPALPVLTLERALESARRVQPSVRQARAATEAAAAREEQARAPQLPQVNLSATYTRQTGNFVPRPGALNTMVRTAPPWSFKSFDFFNFGVNASQLIWDFGQTSARRRSAEATRLAAESSEQTTAHDVQLAVERAYFQARAARALINVARQAVANSERHLQQATGFVSAGLRPEIDLASVRTELANARLQLITATNSYDVARVQLDQAIGQPASGPYDVSDDELPPLPGEDGALAPLVDDAFAHRPELVTVTRQRRAQEQVVAALRGAYWPTLGAAGSANESGTTVTDLVPNWAVAVTLNWPVFQGGLTRGQVREAVANLSSIAAQEDALKLQVRVEVEQGSVSVRAGKAQITAADDAVASAREQLRLAEGRYRAGLGSIIELGDAQVVLTNAQAQAVQARYNLAAARAQLATALGRT